MGIGEPVNGDRIYNGAMDDGSGVAAVLDIAVSLKQHPEKLKRSVIFLLVTAEEKGLLGSKYFVARPTVDAKAIVADINIDMRDESCKLSGLFDELAGAVFSLAPTIGIFELADRK